MDCVKKYIGHKSQISGVEEHRLVGGKGDQMSLLQIRNGKGLNLTLSKDRALDITRLEFKGDNIGYFAPCGYVASSYCENRDNNFLKSFTAGFLTTCGLRNIGVPNIDNNEELPLHGNIHSIPAENVNITEDDKTIVITAEILDENLFDYKLVLNRKFIISKTENSIEIIEEVINNGHEATPVMILYHINFGYPMLDEGSKFYVDSKTVKARDEKAQNNIDNLANSQLPESGFVEECYFHSDFKKGMAKIENNNINKSVEVHFDTKTLDCLTQWKMFGERDYVVGLEPGNSYPDGRKKAREDGTLKYIKPGEIYKTNLKIIFKENI